MKAIEEVYPEENEGPYFCISDYSLLLESFGYEILIQVDDDDYQCQSRLLFRDKSKYGLLIFGWGSCSGCDSLQACGSFTEVDELRQLLANDIHWENSNKAMRIWIDNKDWELEYSWHMDETKEFLDQCQVYLA